ncbi:MAG: hypothetical protein ACI4HI_13990 [Lachnospiraceae bacterium]
MTDRSSKNAKKVFAGAISIVALTLAGGAGYHAYAQYQVEQTIEQEQAEADKALQEFQKETDHDKKCQLLGQFLEQRNDYAKDKEQYDSVRKKKNEILAQMRKEMKEEYDEQFEKLKLDSVEKIKDKKALKKNKTELKAFQTMLQEEGETTLEKETLDSYLIEIEQRLKQDTDRLTQIKEEEKAAKKAKEEAERKAAEEAAAAEAARKAQEEAEAEAERERQVAEAANNQTNSTNTNSGNSVDTAPQPETPAPDSAPAPQPETPAQDGKVQADGKIYHLYDQNGNIAEPSDFQEIYDPYDPVFN